MSNLKDKPSALDLTQDDWEKTVQGLGMKPFAVSQIISWVYGQNILDPEEMTNLPKDGRKKLADTFSWSLPQKILEQKASDGTTKITLKLKDENVIESVLIPNAENSRITACLSSQVGCSLGCKFCRTAKMGFIRNLTLGEILSQVFHLKAISEKPLTNIVFMGMGEPLLNLDNVENAISYLTNDRCFNFAKKRITVSTAGITPNILEFFARTGLKLAVSLNSARPEIRKKLMPIESKYPLPGLIEELKKYSKNKKSWVTFEYIMLEGINDSKVDLEALVKLTSNIKSKINLIPFNPFEGCPFTPSKQETIDMWWRVLYEKGIQTNIRRSAGQEILAACGQLAGKLAQSSKIISHL